MHPTTHQIGAAIALLHALYTGATAPTQPNDPAGIAETITTARTTREKNNNAPKPPHHTPRDKTP